MIVTFDYDGTLTQEKVQVFAKFLMDIGVDVYVLTYRYNDLHAHKWKQNPTNEDMYKVTDAIGIPRHKIMFTNFTDKHHFLKDTFVALHIDDCPRQISTCRASVLTPIVDALQKDCIQQCLNILREDPKIFELYKTRMDNLSKDNEAYDVVNSMIQY